LLPKTKVGSNKGGKREEDRESKEEKLNKMEEKKNKQKNLRQK